MLVGILVIAFPVSVFSDLWSQELKHRGILSHSGTNNHNDSDACCNDREVDHVEEDFSKLKSLKLKNTLDSVLQDEDAFTGNDVSKEAKESYQIHDDRVILTKSDFDDICNHLNTINESQDVILRRMDLINDSQKKIGDIIQRSYVVKHQVEEESDNGIKM